MTAVSDITAAIDNMANVIASRLDNLPTQVWTKGITSNDQGGHANEIIAAIQAGVREGLATQLAIDRRVDPLGARYGVVVDDETGAWYAVAPGTFWHIPDMDSVDAGRDVKLLDEGERHTNTAGAEKIRAMALGGAGDMYEPDDPKAS
jgi:hypothetical protein